MTLAQPLLDVRGLQVEFVTESGVVPAVNDVTFYVDEGESIALLGESGSGKSATALGVMGLLDRAGRISSGQVIFQGTDLVGASQQRLNDVRGREISITFQDPEASLNPLMSVGAQIAEVLRIHEQMSRKRAWSRAVDLMDRVRIPQAGSRANDYPRQFSGGMQQRILIAIAIAMEPRLLIADEPTTALDVTVQAEIVTLLEELRRELGMSLVLITHDLGLASQTAERIYVMYAGRIMEMASVQQLYRDPCHPYTRALIASVPRTDRRQELHSIPGVPPDPKALPSGCEFRPRCDFAEPVCTEVRPPLEPVRPAEKRLSACHFADSLPAASPDEKFVSADHDHGPAGDVVLSARDLRIEYTVRRRTAWRRVSVPLTAVDGVSLEIKRGQCVGLVGESGSGKSSFARGLLGLEEVAAGEVRFRGVNVRDLTPSDRQEFRRRVQIVFQNPYKSLNPKMRVFDIVSEPWVVHPDVAPDDWHAGVESLLHRVGLAAEHADRLPSQFSGGQLQRVGIARALAARPDVILFDEPVSALDVSVQAQIINLLKDIQLHSDIAYLFIAHDLAVVRQLADIVDVMYLGKVVESGPVETIFTRPAHPYTRALLEAIPELGDHGRAEVAVEGELPSPTDVPDGCRFRTRCPLAYDECHIEPQLSPRPEAGHVAACHLDEIDEPKGRRR